MRTRVACVKETLLFWGDNQTKKKNLNFEGEKEKDVETDPPAEDLEMEAENLDYVSYSIKEKVKKCHWLDSARGSSRLFRD